MTQGNSRQDIQMISLPQNIRWPAGDSRLQVGGGASSQSQKSPHKRQTSKACVQDIFEVLGFPLLTFFSNMCTLAFSNVFYFSFGIPADLKKKKICLLSLVTTDSTNLQYKSSILLLYPQQQLRGTLRLHQG